MPARRAPVEQLGNDRARLRRGRSWRRCPAASRGCSSSAVSCAISASSSGRVRPVLVRKQEELAVALGPLAAARRSRPARASRAAPRSGRSARARRDDASRRAPRPPCPPAPLPTSNCGFTSTTASPCGVSTPKTEGSTFSSEMNEMSMVASAGDSGKDVHREVTGVRLLHHHHAAVGPQLGVELSVPHVHRVDLHARPARAGNG